MREPAAPPPDSLDQRALLRAMYPDAPKAWRDAIEAGHDVALLERNAAQTFEQRIRELDRVNAMLDTLRRAAQRESV